jgi:hypothetical protein
MRTAVIVLALTLIGCATGPTAEEHATRATVLYGNDCTRQGYSEGSDAWNRCVAGAYLKYVQRQRENAAAIQAATPPIVLPQQPPLYNPPPPARFCSSYINGQYVTTLCQ